MQWRTLAGILGCLWLVQAAAESLAADPLDLLRSEVRAPDTPAGSGSTTVASSDQQRAAAYRADRQSFNDDHGDNQLWGTLFLAGLAAPYWTPITFTEDDYQTRASFPSYPYQVGDGYLVLDLDYDDIPPGIAPGAWLLRGSSDFGTNFSGTNWVGAQILLDTSTRFGIDSEYRWINELRGDQPDDSTNLGDANVVFRFAQSPQWQFRSGLGLNYLSDHSGSDFGFNFTYGADWFPVQPFALSTNIDLGTLGGATLFHVRTSVGLTWRHAEAYVGYDFLHVESYDLSSLVSGVRLWF